MKMLYIYIWVILPYTEYGHVTAPTPLDAFSNPPHPPAIVSVYPGSEGAPYIFTLSFCQSKVFSLSS